MDGSEPSSGPDKALPENGVRFELVRNEPRSASDEILYEGHAHTSSGSFALRVTVTSEAARASLSGVSDLSPEAAESLEKSAAALVRAATRTRIGEGRPTPRKIVRWRP